MKRFFINDDRIIYLDGKYQVDPKALERAGHAREELEETKKELKKELESYGPKGPSWTLSPSMKSCAEGSSKEE